MQPFVPGGDPPWGSGDLVRHLWLRPNPEPVGMTEISVRREIAADAWAGGRCRQVAAQAADG